MPKSGVDGPTYAGHINTAPEGAEPEWVKADTVTPVEAEVPAETPATPAEDAPKHEPTPRRTRRRA